MRFGTYFRELLISIGFLLIISLHVFAEQIDKERPMYGGIDRHQNAEYVEQDAVFIAKATQTFSTRGLASEGYVEHGFNYYGDDDLGNSMKRFNQAWLLNPENPYAYLGFGLIMKKEEQSCEAYKMFKLANEKGLNEEGFLADYAYTSSQCALLKKENEKQALFRLSNSLHEVATQAKNDRLLAYVYHSWAKSYYLQEQFNKSQEMVEHSKQHGGTIDKDLLQALKENNN